MAQQLLGLLASQHLAPGVTETVHATAAIATAATQTRATLHCSRIIRETQQSTTSASRKAPVLEVFVLLRSTSIDQVSKPYCCRQCRSHCRNMFDAHLVVASGTARWDRCNSSGGDSLATAVTRYRQQTCHNSHCCFRSAQACPDCTPPVLCCCCCCATLPSVPSRCC